MRLIVPTPGTPCVPRAAALALAAALLVPAAARPPAAPATQTYEATAEDFANPERGFYIQRAYPSRNAASSGALREEDLRLARERHMTLVRMLYSLRAYREAPLPEPLLATLAADFARARAAGVKVIPRFSYSSAIGQPDAALDRILAHIDQLTPVLRANADVIAFFEAGFAGAWGEWHSSTNGLFDAGPDVPYPQVNARTRAILDRLLAALPPDRMIALRCPRFKQWFFGEQALGLQDAFSGAAQARTGAINDCLLASPDDMGTYTNRMAAEKAYLHRDNLFVPQGGETCSVGPEAQPFIQCANALHEMAYLRYSNLNSDYHRGVLRVWTEGGCMPEIQRRLGYRFRLLESRIPPRVKPGAALAVSFRVTNEGWANLYNPRPVELVLRNQSTGKTYTLPVPEDPRRWMPGEVLQVVVEGGVPAQAAPGAYDVLLRLPDAAPGLRDHPEYAVRLANTAVWEPATGMNRLQGILTIDPRAPGRRFAGSRWFR